MTLFAAESLILTCLSTPKSLHAIVKTPLPGTFSNFTFSPRNLLFDRLLYCEQDAKMHRKVNNFKQKRPCVLEQHAKIMKSR